MSCSRTQHRDTGEARTPAPQSRVKHSTTEPLCSLKMLVRKANRGDPDQTASEEAVIWVSLVLSMDAGTIVFKILKYFNTILSVCYYGVCALIRLNMLEGINQCLT